MANPRRTTPFAGAALLCLATTTAAMAQDACAVSPTNPGMMRYQVSLSASVREALRLEAGRTHEKQKLAEWIRAHLPEYQVLTEEQRNKVLYSSGICNATFTLSQHLTRQLGAIRQAIPACEAMPAHASLLQKQEKSTEALIYTLASSLLFCEKAGVKMRIVQPHLDKAELAAAMTPPLTPQRPRPMPTNADVKSPMTNDRLVAIDDAQKAAVMARLIRTTWKAQCQPDKVTGGTIFREAGSWQVHCAGSTLPHDYSLSVPLDPRRQTRVLKCWKGETGPLTCDLFGSPAARAIPGQFGAAHPR